MSIMLLHSLPTANYLTKPKPQNSSISFHTSYSSPTDSSVSFLCKHSNCNTKQEQTQKCRDGLNLNFICANKLLKDLSTWGIGGPCNYFVQVHNQTQLVSAIRFTLSFIPDPKKGKEKWNCFEHFATFSGLIDCGSELFYLVLDKCKSVCFIVLLLLLLSYSHCLTIN